MRCARIWQARASLPSGWSPRGMAHRSRSRRTRRQPVARRTGASSCGRPTEAEANVKKLAPILVVTALTATRLEAQYERRYEVGLFGAFTKYDKAFALSDKIGGGVRFSYAVTPMVGLEIEALFQSPQDISATTQIEPLIGGASLVVNTLNASRMTIYALGGYSILDFGGTNPYHFTDRGFHGGAGAKFYMSSRVALRVEARAIYTPQTNSTFGQKATHLVGSAGFAFFQPDAAPA